MKKLKKNFLLILVACLVLTACGKAPDTKTVSEEPQSVEKVAFIENVPDASDKMRTFAWESLPEMPMFEQLETAVKDLASRYEGAQVELFAQEGFVVDYKATGKVDAPYTYTIKASKDGEVKIFHYIMNLNEKGLLEWWATFDETGTQVSMDELNERYENLF